MDSENNFISGPQNYMQFCFYCNKKTTDAIILFYLQLT